MENIYYVYMIRCYGDRLYTGYTSDPLKRFNSHKTGKGGAKFTKGFTPESFEMIWRINGTKGDAMRIEGFIKSLKRKVKDELIKNPSLLKEMGSLHYPDIQITVSDLFPENTELRQ